MMPRYVIGKAPTADESWQEQAAPPLGHPTVYDAGPQDTGLIDQQGNSILRVPDPIGFVQGE